MRHRNLAAIAITATVAATPTLATVIQDLATAPPAAAIGERDCVIFPPYLQNNTVATEMGALDGSCEVPGTLSLQASLDHSHWKTISQLHQNSWSGETVSHQCLAGTWWYQGYFAADDGSFKGGTDSASPTQFTC